MTDIAISVENLSKSYLVGHNSASPERYTALRDVVARNVRNLARKTRDMLHGRAIVQGDEVEEFWALKDVSFEIKQGDRVGIIGRNGAGKSTLLKILSRITEPTQGRIEIAGRVASLLEVGTGFHPELTGRENIFLNGAILGMSRREIQRKFDEIVDFAEIERFLDTPVKRYSSGMYMRLAFAVAAHLEPEILIVDEVLAVGDAQFQQKCIEKLKHRSSDYQTIIFVSHNMTAINQLCSETIILNSGKLEYMGASHHAIGKYFQRTQEDNPHNTNNKKNAIIKINLHNNSNIKYIQTGEDIEFTTTLRLNSKTIDYHLAFSIFDSNNELLTHIINEDDSFKFINHNDIHYVAVKIKLKKLNFIPGEYIVNAWLGDGGAIEIDKFESAFIINIGDAKGLVNRTTAYPRHAKCVIQSEWVQTHV